MPGPYPESLTRNKRRMYGVVPVQPLTSIPLCEGLYGHPWGTRLVVGNTSVVRGCSIPLYGVVPVQPLTSTRLTSPGVVPSPGGHEPIGVRVFLMFVGRFLKILGRRGRTKE